MGFAKSRGFLTLESFFQFNKNLLSLDKILRIPIYTAWGISDLLRIKVCVFVERSKREGWKKEKASITFLFFRKFRGMLLQGIVPLHQEFLQ